MNLTPRRTNLFTLQLSLGVELCLLLYSLLSSLFVVIVYVTVLTHASSIQLLMATSPRLLHPAVAVVAIGAHLFGIVRPVFMATVIDFLSIIK